MQPLGLDGAMGPGWLDPAEGSLVLVGHQQPVVQGAGCAHLVLGGTQAHCRLRLERKLGNRLETQAAVAPVTPHEVGHEVVDRVRQQVRRVGQLGQLSTDPEYGDLVAQLDGLVDVVGDEHYRLAQLALQPEELVLKLLADDRVDRAEGLVHQHHRRVGGQGAGDSDALLLAAGELARVSVGERRRQPHAFQQLQRASPCLLPVPAEQQRHRGDVRSDRAVREQTGLLDHVSDPTPQLGGVHRGCVAVIDPDPALGRFDHPVDHPERGCLAAAGRPHQNRDLARGGNHVQTPDRDGAVRVCLTH
jgi:hypothetical protein